MRAARWYVTALVLALMAAACNEEERPTPSAPRTAPSPSEVASPTTSTTEPPFSTEELARLEKLMGKVRRGDRLGPHFELRNVYYTSATHSVADFAWTGPYKDGATAIATTSDNWAHASTFVVADDVADAFEYVPLVDGIVAVRVGDEYSPRPTPPFILFPKGRIRPLQKVAARPLGRDSTLLDVESWRLPALTDKWNPGKLWAIDIADAELFPVEGSHYGEVRQQVPGRRGETLSVGGFHRRTRTWRFDTSTDGGRTWTAGVADLPSSLRPNPELPSLPDGAVGPDHRQAVAMTETQIDLPRLLIELWQTEDERTFRRVPLPWDKPFVGGIAYTPDGSLLLAEVLEPAPGCRFDYYYCDRPGRIWRLAPGGTHFEPAPHAPALFGHPAMVGITVSGGMIVARTGAQSVSVSRDGLQWIEVTPGR